MGEWYTLTADLNDIMERLKYEKSMGLMDSQKLNKIRENLYSPTKKMTTKGPAFYGSPYQLINSDLIKAPTGPNKYISLSLAGTIDEVGVQKYDTLVDGCQIVATPTIDPIMRNTFCFETVQVCDSTRGDVTYEEEMYIKMMGVPLYMKFTSNILTLGTSAPVMLTSTPNEYCKFKIFFWEHCRRHTGFNTVKFDSRVIIRHMASGKNLILKESRIPTLFGNEYEVTCDIIKDSHKAETAHSFWRIV